MFDQNPVFPANIDEDQFFWPKLTKTTFLGQIRPKQFVSAKIDQNYLVRGENRKMKTAKKPPNLRGTSN